MIPPLWRKDLREHGAVLLVFFGFLAIFVLTESLSKADEGSVSKLEVLIPYARLLAVLGCFFLSGRLVARELGSPTALFLESLPLSRTRILAQKLLLGMAALTVAVVLGLALAKVATRGHESVTEPQLRMAFLRMLGACFAGWGFTALTALLGRYRFPLVIAAIAAVWAADDLSAFDAAQFGPFALLSGDFVYSDRQAIWKPLAQSLALGAGCIAAAFALAGARDGTITDQLARKMTHREKSFVVGVFLLFFSFIAFAQQEKPKVPFALAQSEALDREGLHLQIGFAEGMDREQMLEVARGVAEDILSVQRYFDFPTPRSVALVPWPELDADAYRRAPLTDRDGLVLQANFGAPRFDADGFREYVVHELLVDWSSRSNDERRHWFLDGFAYWYARRNQPASDQTALRAAFAVARGVTPSRAEDWLWAMETAGSCGTGALAGEGIALLAQKLGAERFRALSRDVLRPPSGAGEKLFGSRGVKSMFEAHGVDLASFLSEWDAKQSAALKARREALAPLLALEPHLEVASAGEDRQGASLRHWLGGPSPLPYSLRYARLRPLEGYHWEALLERQEVVQPADGATAPVTLLPGQRWLFTLEVDSPALDCAARLAAHRTVIP